MHFPERCDKCRESKFCPKSKIVEVRQFVELPPIKPIVTEHQAMTRRAGETRKREDGFGKQAIRKLLFLKFLQAEAKKPVKHYWVKNVFKIW